MKPRLYYLGKPGDGFGWGVANTHLSVALQEWFDVTLCADEKRTTYDGHVFVPVLDSSLTPLRRVRSTDGMVMGYCFTVWPITRDAQRNARAYDLLFCGSEWNRVRLKVCGIEAVTLVQGVDFRVFTPQPPSARAGFVVFSGGNFEFRKGQDIVIAAMELFMRSHADVVLLTAWHNPWPESVRSMANSWLIDYTEPLKTLPAERVISLPPLPHHAMPGVIGQCHVGLFPNRCEAGTNLVLMETMACARPVIVSACTGHADVLGPGCIPITTGDYDPAGWFNCSVSDVLCALEWCYAHRAELIAMGTMARETIAPFTWQRAASVIARACGLCGADM